MISLTNKQICCCLVLFFVAVRQAQPDEAEFRAWKDASGKFEVVAQFIAFEGEEVELKRKDTGSVIQIPLAALSLESQEMALDLGQKFLGYYADIKVQLGDGRKWTCSEGYVRCDDKKYEHLRVISKATLEKRSLLRRSHTDRVQSFLESNRKKYLQNPNEGKLVAARKMVEFKATEERVEDIEECMDFLQATRIRKIEFGDIPAWKSRPTKFKNGTFNFIMGCEAIVTLTNGQEVPVYIPADSTTSFFTTREQGRKAKGRYAKLAELSQGSIEFTWKRKLIDQNKHPLGIIHSPYISVSLLPDVLGKKFKTAGKWKFETTGPYVPQYSTARSIVFADAFSTNLKNLTTIGSGHTVFSNKSITPENNIDKVKVAEGEVRFYVGGTVRKVAKLNWVEYVSYSVGQRVGDAPRNSSSSEKYNDQDYMLLPTKFGYRRVRLFDDREIVITSESEQVLVRE